MPSKKRAPQDSTGAEQASKTQRQDNNGEGLSTRSEPEETNETSSNGNGDGEGVRRYIAYM